jgi:4-hydroxy-tetrahydrodipicolinate reductase
LEHEAKNRIGFAAGALLASEWIIGKTGVFGMSDLLNFEN